MVLRIACGHRFQVRALSVSGYYGHCSYYGWFGKKLSCAFQPECDHRSKDSNDEKGTPDPR
jgi:hypothetical protein